MKQTKQLRTISVTFKISPQKFGELKKRAEKKDKSVSALIRELVFK